MTRKNKIKVIEKRKFLNKSNTKTIKLNKYVKAIIFY